MSDEEFPALDTDSFCVDDGFSEGLDSFTPNALQKKRKKGKIPLTKFDQQMTVDEADTELFCDAEDDTMQDDPDLTTQKVTKSLTGNAKSRRRKRQNNKRKKKAPEHLPTTKPKKPQDHDNDNSDEQMEHNQDFDDLAPNQN